MQTLEQEIQTFIDSIRPPANIRNKVDISYCLKNNTLTIHEIRPCWRDSAKTTDNPVAKTKYIKSKDIWKIYWQQATGKWEAYGPQPECPSLQTFFRLLQNDPHGCFWG
jgi:hypothetical protein